MRSGAFFCVRDLSAAQARDGAGCGVSIAGKPAPTGIGCSAGFVGAGLPAMGKVQGQHRRQAGSHRYWVQCRPGMGRVAESASPASRLPQVMGAVQALWEMACQGWGGLQGQHRRQAGSHRYRVQRRPGMGQVAGSASPASRLPQILGAVQARDGAGCRVIIAGKPAPTGNGCSAGLVGAGLPGMGQVAGSASPASRLPQVLGAVQALWELACQGWGRLQGQHRRQAGSHRYWVQCRPGMGQVAESASPASRLPQILGAVQCSAGQGWGGLQGKHRRQAGSHR